MKGPGKHEDAAVVDRLLAGDEEAFEEFFDSTFPRLFRFALSRMGNDPVGAEEVVQATLCQVVRKLHTYRGEAALFTWLCTFCRYEISAYYRRVGSAPEPIGLVEDLPEVRGALDSISAAADDPEERLRRDELGRLVQVTLDTLPVHYADALEWKYIHGLSVKEIAARLELSAKAAESLLTRARAAFRDGFASLGFAGLWPAAEEAGS